MELSHEKAVGHVVRKLGITEQTYCWWRKEYGGLKVSQAKRLRELESTRLKRLVPLPCTRYGGRMLVHLSHPSYAGLDKPNPHTLLIHLLGIQCAVSLLDTEDNIIAASCDSRSCLFKIGLNLLVWTCRNHKYRLCPANVCRLQKLHVRHVLAAPRVCRYLL